MSLLTDLRGAPELLANLTRREIKGKYKRTVLGQLWSLANPLAAMLIYTVVFQFLIRVTPEPGRPSGINVFAFWLMCGLLPWTFFTAVVNGGMGALVGNENLIKKVYFPRITLIVSSSAAALFTWSIEMLVLAVLLVVVGSHLFVWIPLVLGMMILLALFSTGVAMMLSIANVYFRDTQHFVSILFQAWFYLTPILYPISLVAKQSVRMGPLFGDVTVLDLYELNPMVQFIEIFRNLMYDNRMPAPGTVAACVVWTVIAVAIGSWVFEHNQAKLAEAL